MLSLYFFFQKIIKIHMLEPLVFLNITNPPLEIAIPLGKVSNQEMPD